MYDLKSVKRNRTTVFRAIYIAIWVAIEIALSTVPVIFLPILKHIYKTEFKLPVICNLFVYFL